MCTCAFIRHRAMPRPNINMTTTETTAMGIMMELDVLEEKAERLL